MLILNNETHFLVAKIAELPQWALLLGTCLAVTVGLAIGWAFWRQFKLLAGPMELATRKAQSEFDLVSRDVFKAKQDATTLIASRKRKI